MLYLRRVAHLDHGMTHKQDPPHSSLDHITVADVVQFLLWLPDDKREQAIDLLRAIQNRRWYEIWHEPLVLGENH